VSSELGGESEDTPLLLRLFEPPNEALADRARGHAVTLAAHADIFPFRPEGPELFGDADRPFAEVNEPLGEQHSVDARVVDDVQLVGGAAWKAVVRVRLLPRAARAPMVDVVAVDLLQASTEPWPLTVGRAPGSAENGAARPEGVRSGCGLKWVFRILWVSSFRVVRRPEIRRPVLTRAAGSFRRQS